MDTILKKLNYFDWIASIISILAGIYFLNYWLILGGILGLVLAYLKPALKLKKFLETKLFKKQEKREDSGKVLKEDAFYAQILAEPPVKNLNFGVSLQKYNTIKLSKSRHNLLTSTSLNLFSTKNSNYF